MSTPLDLAKVGELIAELKTPEGEAAMACILHEREKEAGNKKRAASATPSPGPKSNQKVAAAHKPDPKSLKENTVVEEVDSADGAPPDAKKIKTEKANKMTTRNKAAKVIFKIESDDEDKDPAKKKFKKEAAKITERFRVGVDTYLREKSGNLLTGFDTIEELEACFDGRDRFLRMIYKPIHRVWTQVRQPKDIEAKGLSDFMIEIIPRWNLNHDEEMMFRNMPKRKND